MCLQAETEGNEGTLEIDISLKQGRREVYSCAWWIVENRMYISVFPSHQHRELKGETRLPLML